MFQTTSTGIADRNIADTERQEFNVAAGDLCLKSPFKTMKQSYFKTGS